jgi:hypothetical protein
MGRKDPVDDGSTKESNEEMANPRGNPQNLKPWQPGESGNPGGRPKTRPMREYYKEELEELAPEELVRSLKMKEGATFGRALARGQIISGIKGKAQSAREIRETVEGKTPQPLELGEAGEPIKLSTEETIKRIQEIYGIRQNKKSK